MLEGLKGFVNEVKQAGLIIEVHSAHPFVQEIQNIKRREEFAKDYKRLLPRCGRGAMDAIFNLYIIEQNNVGERPFSKAKIFVYNNTAKILTRFAEKGWIDIYLTKTPISSIEIQTDSHTVNLKGGTLLSTAVIKPNYLSQELIKKRHQNARRVPKNQVRAEFAKIDRKYKGKKYYNRG